MRLSAAALRIVVLILFAALLCTTGFYCGQKNSTDDSAAHSSPWHNVYDTSIGYVGMDACRSCHADIYASFMETGMGQSFAPATRSKSIADFSPQHAHVYDTALDLHYRPYWQGDSLFFLEYRLDGKDTVHKLRQRIDYIIGSGQHTNSHLYSENGYLYQAPITFYAQKQQWDLAPGFEDGASSRFSRMIESECITCHNGYPKQVQGSLNKYVTLKHGIDCERCHGPGAQHVADKMAGKIVDTSKGPDYSIVNPRRLSTELQNNVCQRCHLQGTTVINPGKTFFDFHPGMKLSEVMNTFQPQFAGAGDQMIMASHVERMKQSPCYINSGKMSCITCHNPHVSVKVTPRAHFNAACATCHSTDAAHAQPGKSFCTENPAVRAAQGNDCITCHMPQNKAIDIPHVAVTDHYIRRRPQPQGSAADSVRAFLGLRCFNNGQPSPATIGQAYALFFETKAHQQMMLDSALYYLQKAPADEAFQGLVHAWYLKGNFGKVLEQAAGRAAGQITDAWTAYRIGESFNQMGRPQEALPFYRRASEILPYALDFQNKLGTCQLQLNDATGAAKTFEFILAENPRHPLANANLGFVRLQQGDMQEAYQLLNKALMLDPNHEQTLINLAVWAHNSGSNSKAAAYLKRLLKRNPEHAQARAMLRDLAGR